MKARGLFRWQGDVEPPRFYHMKIAAVPGDPIVDGIDSGNVSRPSASSVTSTFVPACLNRSGLVYVYVGVGCCYRAFVRAKGCGDTDEVRHGAACDEFDLQRSGNNSRAAQGPLVVAAHDGATNRRSALFAETVFGISDMLLAICIYERLKNAEGARPPCSRCESCACGCLSLGGRSAVCFVSGSDYFKIPAHYL